LQEQGTEGGDSGRAGAYGRPWECSDEESFHTFANKRDWCMLGAVFEAKKEIPA